MLSNPDARKAAYSETAETKAKNEQSAHESAHKIAALRGDSKAADTSSP